MTLDVYFIVVIASMFGLHTRVLTHHVRQASHHKEPLWPAQALPASSLTKQVRPVSLDSKPVILIGDLANTTSQYWGQSMRVSAFLGLSGSHYVSTREDGLH